MAIHAAMIDRMDREIGRYVAALEQAGLLENTLICFASDNGASAKSWCGMVAMTPTHLREVQPAICALVRDFPVRPIHPFVAIKRGYMKAESVPLWLFTGPAAFQEKASCERLPPT
jgi:arylsulfatase A-like enzyme